METGLTKNKILSELSRSPHGKLAEYKDVTLQAAKEEPEFLAHLIAWNEERGQIRDSKVAIPIISLMEDSFHEDFVQNSLAHIANLGPRELLKGFKFVNEINPTKKSGLSRLMRKLVSFWLKEAEAEPSWDRLGIQHRATLKELYAQSHTKPGTDRINIILFGRDLNKNPQPLPKGSIFEAVHLLKNMSASEAAGTILEWKIPFLIAQGALGKKIQETDLVLALIKRMSATELVTNMGFLEKLGVNKNQALRGALDEALKSAQSSKKNVLKTSRAAENIKDETLKANLRGLQDKQLSTMGVEGNWLVLGDRSGSMANAIEISRQVSATLAKMVKGKVWLIFFDTSPQAMDVTGFSLDQINEKTKHVRAGGLTSIGCGLQYILERKEEIDGIAVVSDGGENAVPWFHDVYKRYSEWSGKEVPVYLYLCDGGYEANAFKANMHKAGIDLQTFDVNKKTDFYSLPNMVQTMRTNRYSLVDEVMNSKLLTLKDVFKHVTFDRKEVRV